MLAHFNRNKWCEIRTDACTEGLDVIILQEFEGNMHPIAHASRTLTKEEKNYTVSELEGFSHDLAMTTIVSRNLNISLLKYARSKKCSRIISFLPQKAEAGDPKCFY